MVRGRRKTLVKVAVAAALSASLCLRTVDDVEAKHYKDSKSEWLSGDFHQHTYYTDGSTTFDFVMEKNNEFGLDWWANSEHGGSRNRDGEGDSWLDTTKYSENPILGDNPEAGYMYRWQSLRGTNLAVNTASETDAAGNPLSDFLATDNLDLDGADEAWADLWFYSNPIFVYVR